MSLWIFTCSVALWIILNGIGGIEGVDTWELHRYCNRQALTYGGVLTFDSNLLTGSFCQMNIVANGTGPTALSVYFTKFEVSPGCPANFTLIEDTSYGTVRADPPPGLYQSFCKNDPYLNENLMYTTNGARLSLVYKRTDTRPYSADTMRMTFTLKMTSFKAGVIGCTKNEIEHQNMVSCGTGRCISRELTCRELNPCGDYSDCFNSTGPIVTTAGEDSGGFYIKFLALTFVAVFLLFASIQICLMVRRRRRIPCHTPSNSKPAPRLDAEHIPIGGGAATSANGHVRKTSPDNESLIEYHVES